MIMKAWARQYPAYVLLAKAATRTPGRRFVTPSPTASIVPAASRPGVSGSLGFTAYVPWRKRVSAKFTPTAWFLTSTIPGRSSGLGTSATDNTSGPPSSAKTMALMAPPAWPYVSRRRELMQPGNFLPSRLRLTVGPTFRQTPSCCEDGDMVKRGGVVIACVLTLAASLCAAQDSPIFFIPERTPAPSFTLPDLAGRRVSSTTFSGRVVVLRFAAPGGPTCTSERKSPENLQRRLPDAALVYFAA